MFSIQYGFQINIDYSFSILVELSALRTVVVRIVHIHRVLRADLNIISRNLVRYGVVGIMGTFCR